MTAIGLSGGGYRSLALQAAPEVKSVSLVKRGGGQIDVILQGRGADGSVADDVVSRVRTIILDNDELTDIVSVRSARPKPYKIVAHALVPPGPAVAPVQAASEAALASAASALQIIGRSVPTDALIAAGRAQPMLKFTLAEPSEDVSVAPDEVSYCVSITVTAQAIDG
jgi:phage-related baseplate assembly protein